MSVMVNMLRAVTMVIVGAEVRVVVITVMVNGKATVSMLLMLVMTAATTTMRPMVVAMVTVIFLIRDVSYQRSRVVVDLIDTHECGDCSCYNYVAIVVVVVANVSGQLH